MTLKVTAAGASWCSACAQARVKPCGGSSLFLPHCFTGNRAVSSAGLGAFVFTSALWNVPLDLRPEVSQIKRFRSDFLAQRSFECKKALHLEEKNLFSFISNISTNAKN